MRTNFVDPERVSRGHHCIHTKARRVNVFLDDETFDLLREQAAAKGVGMSAVVREVIDAGMIKKLPHS